MQKIDLEPSSKSGNLHDRPVSARIGDWIDTLDRAVTRVGREFSTLEMQINVQFRIGSK
jgi:hypothetical protein